MAEVQSILDTHAAQHAQQVHPPDAQRTTSPSFFSNLKPRTRGRSNTNPTPSARQSIEVTPPQMAYKELAAAFYTINSKYRISWECADLLIELGGTGTGSNTNTAITSAPPTSTSAPSMPPDTTGTKKGRERAITLAGDESKPAGSPLVGSTSLPGSAFQHHNSDPATSTTSTTGPPLASPPSMSWRASTGRHDLSQRQLVLLKEMLNNANATATSAGDESHLSIPEESLPLPHPHSQSLQALHALQQGVNRDWRWGDVRNSTITLPSEESAGVLERTDKEKKRRSGKLGMSGLRDMLRALKRHAESEAGPLSPLPSNPLALPPMPHSTTSLSTESSHKSGGRHWYPHPRIPSGQRRRAKTSTGPESMRSTREKEKERPTSPHPPSSFSAPKPSPRRPSLASIFRIGKGRPTSTFEEPTPPPPTSSPPSSSGTAEESSGSGSCSTGEEEDWDRMDSASDLDAAARGLNAGADGAATVRGRVGGSGRRVVSGGKKGKSPYHHDPMPASPPVIVPKRSFSASQSSLRLSEHHQSSAQRPIRLSNVEEHAADDVQPNTGTQRSTSTSNPRTGVSPSRPTSSLIANHKTGSVRSMPPQLATTMLPDPKLAMTPENIKPLLENAKEVHARLSDCIVEIRALIAQGQ